jgi:uncharacterized protein (DUF305 family)
MPTSSPPERSRRATFAIAVLTVAIALTAVLLTQRAPAHNRADATYAASMVPHHQLGVRMAELAVARADNVLVRRLAFKMQNYQKAELVSLERWTQQWRAAAGDHIHGMLTPEQEARLANLTGADFDRAFLTDMIRHHEGAIEMSTTEIRDGRSPGAKTVARSVVKIQQDQVDQMRELLTLVG